MPALLKTYYDLCKAPIALFAACSAATGYLLAPSQHAGAGVLSVAGVFMIACGASALNQVQERDIDAKMERTRRRPLPSGVITVVHASALSATLMLAGLLLLLHGGGGTPFLLGLFAVLWYNGIYTFLKRVTAFASAPGALVGAIPPAIGWTAAGSALLDARLIAVCIFFFMWQIPHFWLLLLNQGEEYDKAGLPSLVRVFNRRQITRIIFVWICATAVACLLFPLYGAVHSPVLCFALIPAAGWLVWSGRTLAGENFSPSHHLFKKMNFYLFLMMSLLSLESIFFRMP